MSEAAISIHGVTKRFRDKVAVNELDLEVPMGSLCGFLGPNGAGKTTTIRMVMSIFFPDSGNISVLGKKTAIESKDRIGYLPEERGVYRKMKVGDFLLYIAKLKGVAGGNITARIDDWLERIGLADVRKKKCQELSKGMQQKIQFVATIIHDPDLIILDEPFSGLDPVNVRLLRELLDELHRSGKTIIFSTHVLHEADALCNRIFMINQGRKILDGHIDDIRAEFDPRSIIVQPVDPADLTREALEGMDQVRSVSMLENRAFDVHLHDNTDPQHMMKRLFDHAPMRRVELRRPTLEDIFVNLVSTDDSEDVIRASLKAEPVMEGSAS